MGKVGGNERVRVRRGDSLEQIAKKHGVKPEDITRADGTAASATLSPGETLVIHHRGEPNRTQAIINLLAETMAAKEAAEEAGRQAADARRQLEAEQAREEAFNSAAEDFNGTVKKIRVMLTQAEGNETTLADREKVVKELHDLAAAADAGVVGLEASSQQPAQDVVEGLRARIGKADIRAQQERAKLTELDKMVDADYKNFTATAGEKKKRNSKYGKQLKELFVKYQDPAKMIEGLPPDARKAIGDKIAMFNKDLHRTMVRFSDESWLDERDNGYLLGRPGPKMIKHTKAVEKWLESAPGPVSPDQRTDLLEHLSEMDEAVRDFDDPIVKQAARAVYDDVFARATARLSGK